MQKKRQFIRRTLLNLIALCAILLVSDESLGAAKRVPYEPDSPVVNLNIWKYDHGSRAFRYNGREKVIYLENMTPDQFRFINSMYSLPIDELSIYVNLFQTGCLSWSKNAYKKADEWNKKNPDQQVMLQRAAK